MLHVRRFAARRLGIKIEMLRIFPHYGKCSLAARSGAFGKNMLYLAAPGLFTLLRKGKFWETDEALTQGYGYPPSWLTVNDHLLAVFRGGR